VVTTAEEFDVVIIGGGPGGYASALYGANAGLRIAVVERDHEGVILTATQKQSRVPLSDAALSRVFFSHPLLTLKVIGGIHFEAARLWAKGLRIVPRPPAPDQPVTVHKIRQTDEPQRAIGRR